MEQPNSHLCKTAARVKYTLLIALGAGMVWKGDEQGRRQATSDSAWCMLSLLKDQEQATETDKHKQEEKDFYKWESGTGDSIFRGISIS